MIYDKQSPRAPFQAWINFIPRISNQMPTKVWDDITYKLSDFNF